MAQNLDWKWDGLDLSPNIKGNSSKLNAVYYNNDEATYGINGYKCGLCYNTAAKHYLNNTLLPSEAPGWRVPTREDVLALKGYINDSVNDGYILSKDDLSWAPDWHGSNEYNFDIIPSGSRGGVTLGGVYVFDGFSWLAAFHTASTNGYWGRWLNNNPNTYLDEGYFSTYPLYSIRLVKSLT